MMAVVVLEKLFTGKGQVYQAIGGIPYLLGLLGCKAVTQDGAQWKAHEVRQVECATALAHHAVYEQRGSWD
jgi:hypothetical protein